MQMRLFKEEKMMSLFGKLQEKYQENKAQKQQEEEYVKNNRGTEAICAYMKAMFEKDNPAYQWLKSEKTPLYPVVGEDCVSLCYMQAGNGQSIRDIKPSDIAVFTCSFQQMYDWYGLGNGEGYSVLNTKVEKKALEQFITWEVEKLQHLKYNGGFLVKLFA